MGPLGDMGPPRDGTTAPCGVGVSGDVGGPAVTPHWGPKCHRDPPIVPKGASVPPKPSRTPPWGHRGSLQAQPPYRANTGWGTASLTAHDPTARGSDPRGDPNGIPVGTAMGNPMGTPIGTPKRSQWEQQLEPQ